jgi:hypothetical protein
MGFGIKGPEREDNHSPPFITKDKNAWSYMSTHSDKQDIHLHDVVLVKHWDNFTVQFERFVSETEQQLRPHRVATE